MHLRNFFITFILIQAITLAAVPAFASSNENTPEKANFMVLADIHFDPFLNCYNTKSCPFIAQLRAAPVERWEKLFADNDKSVPRYGYDSGYPLMSSALASAKEIARVDHARFVLVLGDFLGHEFRFYYKKYSGDKTSEGYQIFVRKTLQFVTSQIARSFPDFDVYAATGNNDSYQDDYVSDPHGKFFKDNAVLWSGLIKDKKNRSSMHNQFANAGYYAVTLPGQPGLRLIVLNTNLFSYKAKGKGVNNAANEELNWLHDQLQSAREQHQKVFLAMHIPEGIDVYATPRTPIFTIMQLWQTPYQERFEMELQLFSGEIAAILPAHLHTDWLHIRTYDANEIPASGTPSISPIFGNNPGFKTYTYSAAAFKLLNTVSYIYPLNSNGMWLQTQQVTVSD